MYGSLSFSFIYDIFQTIMSIVSIREVTPPEYFPEKAPIDQGLTLSMKTVLLETGRLVLGSAFAEMDPNGFSIAEEELERAYSIYNKLYPRSFEEFRANLQIHRLSFIYPVYSDDPDNVTLSFGIGQSGRNNGFAVNLAPSTLESDRESLIVLQRNMQTNVPLSIGAGEYEGYFGYAGPSFIFDRHGNRIVDAVEEPASTSIPAEARLFIIPGRISTGVDLVPQPDPDPKWGGWAKPRLSRSDVFHAAQLPRIELATNEIPPSPHIVIVRWAAVTSGGEDLATPEKRARIADKMW